LVILILLVSKLLKGRNRLIHLYTEVNDEQVSETLQSRLSDFKTFLDNIAIFLKLEKIYI